MTVNSQVAPAVQGSVLRRELGMRSKDPQKLAEFGARTEHQQSHREQGVKHIS